MLALLIMRGVPRSCIRILLRGTWYMPIAGILEFFETLDDVCHGRHLEDELPIYIEINGKRFKVDDITDDADAIVIMAIE